MVIGALFESESPISSGPIYIEQKIKLRIVGFKNPWPTSSEVEVVDFRSWLYIGRGFVVLSSGIVQKPNDPRP